MKFAVIVIIRLMLSLLIWPKVITLSGFYCICNGLKMLPNDNTREIDETSQIFRNRRIQNVDIFAESVQNLIKNWHLKFWSLKKLGRSEINKIHFWNQQSKNQYRNSCKWNLNRNLNTSCPNILLNLNLYIFLWRPSFLECNFCNLNLVRILPWGVESKNAMGARRRWVSIFWWIRFDDWRVAPNRMKQPSNVATDWSQCHQQYFFATSTIS